MSDKQIEIITVNSKKEQKELIKLPWKIYKNDPNWVPQLIIELKEMMDRTKYPFFEHSEAEFFIAKKDGTTVGRIAAIKNNRHIKVHKENIGFFGFFECVNDQEIANKLFDTATNWCREKGVEALRGPANYSQNDTCGLLVDAFDQSPVILMTYNPPYYQQLIENYGFTKAMDLYAYYLSAEKKFPERVIKLAEEIKARLNVTVRQINVKDFWNEVEKVKQVYNQAWAPNWGFVPLTDNEIKHIAESLKMAIDPEIVYMAEDNGKPVGFSLAVPDMNQALKHANGRLFPFGLLKILWYKRKIDNARVIIMGVIPEYQRRGIDTVFYWETYRHAVKKGYKGGEFSWILDSNTMMNRAAKLVGAHIYKTYRMYQKPIQ
ncbi:N-acetyltransferase [candidate division KSB1 bacterium]|nr:N-acetyltransferase [candidate division KSB1 bacterium]